MNKEKGMLSRIVALFSKFMLMIGVVLAFYKLPGILAEKISYRELKRRTIKQDLTEEEYNSFYTSKFY